MWSQADDVRSDAILLWSSENHLPGEDARGGDQCGIISSRHLRQYEVADTAMSGTSALRHNQSLEGHGTRHLKRRERNGCAEIGVH